MVKIHMSTRPVDLSHFEPRHGNQFRLNRLFYNPRGFWYSCGDSWVRHMLTSEKDYSAYHFYSLDTSRLRICQIKTLADLDAFNRKYHNPEAIDLAHIIDWMRVKEEYDGLEICPFPSGKYSDLFRVIHATLPVDMKGKISDILFRGRDDMREEDFKGLSPTIRTGLKELLVDSPKFAHRMWCIGWEVQSGVIWKNYSKVGLTSVTF
jgi:hypothetical protein